MFIFLCPHKLYYYYNNILIKKGIARSLFKESKIPILKNTKLIVDSGYQGIQKNHNNVLIPTKKTKKNHLNKEQKQYNRIVAKMRIIIIENIFAILKKFKIITEKYRNRRKRFGLRFNLNCLNL
ncbi:transposase family protein [Spiroplasma poulsonii]|uniref:transposase family protein n=1 Tax=Spiroplasma poulsonii TaxID=2138 RepID=UPI001319CD80